MGRGNLAASSCVVALIILAPMTMAAQESGWVVPRTPWGDPDLMGTYTNKMFTPLQRPPELAGPYNNTYVIAQTPDVERQGRASSR